MEVSPTEIDVLHVDDEPNLADLVATFLEREDDRITVHTATTPKVGLKVLKTSDIDCIVSDYDMPERNGIELLQTVREDYPNLPFILYTGKGSEEIAGKAISNGVTDYLQKCSGTEQYALLANRIDNAVSQYKTERYADFINGRYQALFQQAEVAIGWVEFVGEDPIIRDANPAFEELFCGDEDTVVGEPIDKFVTAEERKSVVKELDHRVRNGELISREVTGAATDGTRTLRAQVIPGPTPDGGELNNAFVLYAPSKGTRSHSESGRPDSSQS